MKYVLDASVAIAAIRSNEDCHAAALKRCTPLFLGEDEIVVPAIFDLEVTSALIRRGVERPRIEAFFDEHLLRRTLMVIGPRVARKTRRIISLTGLRAADALYVWVAAEADLPLIALDSEVLKRSSRVGVASMPP